MANASVTPDADTVERIRDRRADCMDARTVLWRESSLERVRSCGRWSIRQDGSVAVRLSTAGDRSAAGYAGLASCGSVWACPVCARKVASARQADLETACSRWEGLDGSLAMLSLTVSHRQGQRLKSVWDAVRDGWHSITSGRAWKRNADTFGIEGWTRVTETTVGDAGWHVHVHVVLFLHHGLGADERRRLAEVIYQRWSQGIAKTGFAASRAHGVDVKMMHGSNASAVLADYFTKGVYSPDGTAPRSVSMEATRGDLKGSRGGTRTPFQVLYDFIVRGEVEDLDIWHEWERASKGRRQMSWSKGFRELLRLTRDRTDEEIAAEELGTDLDDVVGLPADTVKVIRWKAWELLDVAETNGGTGLRVWLDAQQLAWFDPGRAGPAAAGG